jgi:hypothetical protein
VFTYEIESMEHDPYWEAKIFFLNREISNIPVSTKVCPWFGVKLIRSRTSHSVHLSSILILTLQHSLDIPSFFCYLWHCSPYIQSPACYMTVTSYLHWSEDLNNARWTVKIKSTSTTFNLPLISFLSKQSFRQPILKFPHLRPSIEGKNQAS